MKKGYNNLENIDTLIERLEANMPTSTIDDTRVKKALAKRAKQIEELKQIRDEARRQVEVEKELEKIEKGNEEIGDVINELKRLVKVKKREINNNYLAESRSSESNYYSPSYSSYSSESRSGESNCYYSPSYSSYSSESRSSESRW